MSGYLFNPRRLDYSELSSKEQENVNVTRLLAALAERGIEGFRVNNDKHCADVVAHDPRSGQNLNLQVKGNRRVVVTEKYTGRGVWIVTWDPKRSAFFFYDHDLALAALKATGRWMKKGHGGTSNGGFDRRLVELLETQARGEWLFVQVHAHVVR